MQFLKDIFHIFFPNLCVHCSIPLVTGEKFLCLECNHQVVPIPYDEYHQKMLQSTFYGSAVIEQISSYMYFRKATPSQSLIHALKYRGQEAIGTWLAKRVVIQLQEQHLFESVTAVMPVPLHSRRLKERGYNQVTAFGTVLARTLGVVYLTKVLKRVSTRSSQTILKRFERFSNSDTLFTCEEHALLRDAHILLVDDVITTGATLLNCCEQLYKVGVRKISICTMAYTPKE